VTSELGLCGNHVDGLLASIGEKALARTRGWPSRRLN
jgi:hypothetical protein